MMDVMKGINRITNIVNQIEYEYLHIEIRTKNDTFILDKTKQKNQIGFSTVKGGE